MWVKIRVVIVDWIGLGHEVAGLDWITSCKMDPCPTLPPHKGFYRSANAIFGKVGRIASEEVVLQLLNSKCIPVLLYGLEACSCLLYTSPSPRDGLLSRMPSSA